MYNLLIVDDEPIIVDGLFQMFSELEMDLELHFAYSAKEALHCALQTKIDIIIVDMRMPEKSGLQLIDELLLLWPECRIIFLTGYDEFDHIYDAVKRNIDNYILKIEDDDVLISAVEKSIEVIEEVRQIENKINVNQRRIDQAEPLLKREFLKSLLKGTDQDTDKVLLDFGLEHDVFEIVIKEKWLLIVGQLEHSSNSTFQDLLILDGIFKRELHPGLAIESCMYNKRVIVWLIQSKNVPSVFGEDQHLTSQRLKVYSKRLLESTQEKFLNKTGLIASFVIDKEFSQAKQASESFSGVYQMSKFVSSFSKEMIVIDLSKETTFRHLESKFVTAQPWEDKLTLLEEFISDGDKEKALEVINNQFNQMIRTEYSNIEITYIVLSITQLILEFLQNKDLYSEVMKNTDDNLQHILRQVPILFDSKEKVVLILSIICDYKEEWKKNRNRRIILSINKYIRDNISGDLSLVAMADLVHFNPSYLSRFYKEHTGSNLSDVINKTRLKKAKNLLVQTEKPILEIAEELGFNSPSYFTLYFKKHINQSPQKYRESQKM